MKYLQPFSLLLLFCLFYSCIGKTKQKATNPINDSLIIVDIDACQKEELKASYFFNNVKTIILETNENTLIRRIGNIAVQDSLIVVFDVGGEGDLFVFHLDGRFSHKIGNRGDGPGEHGGVGDFSLDKEKNEVYILERSGRRVMKYKLSTGEFINSIQNEVNRFPTSIQYFGNHLYLDACDIIDNNKDLLYKLNKDTGSEIGSWLNADDYNCEWMKSYRWPEGFFLSKCGENPRYTQFFMDTVMSITSTGIKPYLVVQSKNWVQTKDFQNKDFDKTDALFYMREKNKVFGIRKLIEIQDAVFFTLEINDEYSNYYVFTSPRETRIFHRMVDDLVYKEERFVINDMVYSDDKGVYSISNPRQFADFAEQSMQETIQEGLDKRDLLLQLSEDSNPVIFYYEYK